METIFNGKDLTVTGLRDFDLKHIFDCGQCFRFNSLDENTYIGAAGNRALKISQSANTVTLYDTTPDDWDSFWYAYFDMGRDYGEIKRTLSENDTVMREATQCGSGIRILRQDLWETVVSFIISASNNIPRIKGIIERFCENFGGEISYMGRTFYSFPDAKTTASLTEDDLSVIRVGFRSKYILDAAKKFRSGELSENILSSLSYDDAKASLMTIAGVGNKVSDCILLFGLGKTSAYPVDVWIKRVTEYFWFDGEEQSIEKIKSFAQNNFGCLGGFAQQYLFYYARENKIGAAKGDNKHVS